MPLKWSQDAICHSRMLFAMVTTVAFLCAVLVTYMKRILKKVATEEEPS
jgi:hypothetical protein